MSSSEKDAVKDRKDIRSFLIQLLVTVLAVWIVFGFIFGIASVRGEGMYPRIRDGDLVLYYRLDKSPAAGDAVVYKEEGQRCYGRVVAREGDTVDLTDEGELVINGNVQTEEIFYPTYKQGENVQYPVTLGADEYFILGDFRTNAVDSRFYGPVSKSRLGGKIIAVFRRRGI